MEGQGEQNLRVQHNATLRAKIYITMPLVLSQSESQSESNFMTPRDRW